MKPFTTSDGLKLDYLDVGTGPVVLALPGLTRDLHDFDELAQAMGGEIRLVRLTMRGRKGSDFDPEWKNYNVAQETRDVVEFMDFLRIDQAVVVGTSRGGLIAMVMAATVGERLSGVVLNDIGPVIEAQGMEFIKANIGFQPAEQDPDKLVELLKSLMEAEFPGLPDSKWRALAYRWLDVSDSGIRLSYDPKLRDAFLATEEGAPADMWPLFDMMKKVPLALIRGANSDLLSMQTVQMMQARRPDMLFTNVPDRGHIPFLDEPESLLVLRELIGLAK